jgi:hypothetical protein
MSVLKSLKFTALPKVSDGRNPVIQRRARLIEQLEDQLKLLADPAHSRTVSRWTTSDGQRVQTEKTVKVHPWWRTDEKGGIVFFVRHGWKTVEFEKGKAGVIVASEDKLKGVIEALITATKAGELDVPLADVSSATTSFQRAKRAA